MNNTIRYFINTSIIDPRHALLRAAVIRGTKEGVEYQYDCMMASGRWNEHYSMKWMVEFLQSQHYFEVKRCRYLKFLRELGVKQS